MLSLIKAGMHRLFSLFINTMATERYIIRDVQLQSNHIGIISLMFVWEGRFLVIYWLHIYW